MKPNSSNETNKVIILVIAIVAVFGLLIWRTMAATSGGSPEPAAPVVIGGPPAGSTPATGAPAAPAAIVELSPPTNADSIEPFRKVLATPSTGPSIGSGATAVVNSAPPAMRGNLPIVPDMGKLIPTSDATLTGVMSGDPMIGVFRVGGKDEIKRVGETLSNGFRVVSVTNDSAVLKKKKTRITLQIGPSA